MSVNTIYGQRANLLCAHDIPYHSIPGTTLNEKLNVQPTFSSHSTKKYPKRKYVGLGIGGHKQVLTPHGVLVERHNLFEPYYSQLFNHVPFVLRDVDDDLTIEERVNYRMRAVVEIDGVQKVGYYLKLITDFPSDVNPLVLSMDAGNISQESFVFDSKYQSILDTELRTLENFDHDTRMFDAMVVSLTASLLLTADETDELINSINLMYGGAETPLISEAGIFAAIETSSNPILPTDLDTYSECDLTVLSTYSAPRLLLTAGTETKVGIEMGGTNLLSRSVDYVQ